MEEKKENRIFLRRATMEDAEDLLRWRNDETTRANSFTKDVIDLDSHKKWLSKKLSQSDCHLFVMMDGDEKVGNIRVDVEGDVGEISYMIAPKKRGRGYGKKIIALVEKEMPAEVKTLIGLTLKDNKVSGRCFLANGYTASDAEDALCYSKGIN
ncbi:GNAT family N-acetyltransferase [Butyrivibrio sp. CB08]|uniref:GNAT family N-acetyltransferase n=1 Tax=Butyrivibrio sp. CB08 TaxID=2364879 RepID=UPI001313DEB0|nr:GNAT family N-acetyltransferase [Butyrivibrio sp. CB08]